MVILVVNLYFVNGFRSLLVYGSSRLWVTGSTSWLWCTSASCCCTQCQWCMRNTRTRLIHLQRKRSRSCTNITLCLMKRLFLRSPLLPSKLSWVKQTLMSCFLSLTSFFFFFDILINVKLVGHFQSFAR